MLLPPGRELGDRTFIGLNAGTILPGNNRNPEYHSWNVSVQREIFWNSVVETNYTGSTHLFLPITTLTPLDPQYWSMGRTALNAAVHQDRSAPDDVRTEVPFLVLSLARVFTGRQQHRC
jgi:hypothetical protein